MEYASLAALRAQVAEVRSKMRALGSVNVGAVEEYQEVRGRYESLKAQVEDVEESRDRLVRMIGELNGQMRDIFRRNFAAINGHFGRVFAELFGGGEASLALEDENDVLNSGIEIRVSPPGKVIKNLEALSGGERALVAISIYFAILAVNPSPFCILDEIEARPGPTPTWSALPSICGGSAARPNSSSSPTAAAPWRPPTSSTA